MFCGWIFVKPSVASFSVSVKPELLVKHICQCCMREVSKFWSSTIIHYQSVQKKANNKYDMCHKDVLTRFGGMLRQGIHDFSSTVTKVGMFK